MAVIKIPADNVTLTDAQDVTTFLAVRGIEYERWTPSREVPAGAPPQDILDAYSTQIETLKRRGGYVTADVIDVNPETPNLDAMLAKFNKEHWHDEDEVRFIIEGRGLFHVNAGDSVFVLEVGRGDLIRVPRGTHHWFDLCAEKRIRAIRLFQNSSGWTPHYTDSGVDRGFQPLCFGPAYVGALGTAALIKRVDEPFDLAAAGIEVVLLDIEGTTTPISFVHQRLFPYARARAAEFLQQHASDLEIQRVVSELRGLQNAADSDAPAGDIVSFVHFLIDNDRKLGPLKALQGRIWEQGYAISELEGEVYADVLPAFDRWTRADIRVAIFSSGSVLAQRLLFSNSTAGDLSPYISKYFDTSVGAKGDAASYRRIVKALDLRAPSHVLFVSDVVRELDAARDAGLRTLLCVRPASPIPERNSHPIVETFDVLRP